MIARSKCVVATPLHCVCICSFVKLIWVYRFKFWKPNLCCEVKMLLAGSNLGSPTRTTRARNCLYCLGPKENPRWARVFMQDDSKFCVLCLVEEDVSICRKCSVPWNKLYDMDNHFSVELERLNANEAHKHLLCLQCIRQKKETLTLPVGALDEESQKQLDLLEQICEEEGEPGVELIAWETIEIPARRPPSAAHPVNAGALDNVQQAV